MRISIVTVSYNSAATLEHTILSVLDQDHKDLEYIIVDGGSTDGTRQIIQKYKTRISQVISEPDKGLYDALNKGIDLCTGDVVGLLHSDDFYVDQKVISDYVRMFESTGADAVYSDLYYVQQDNTEKVFRRWKSGKFSRSSFYLGWMPPHPTFFVKRNLYDRFGKFDLSFKSAADYELMLRFIQRYGISLSYLPRFTVKMRVGGKSNASVGGRLRANKEDRRAWKINNLRPLPFTFILKPLRKLGQFL